MRDPYPKLPPGVERVRQADGTECLEWNEGTQRFRLIGDYPGCDQSIPALSWRFGEHRHWHRRYPLLYYDFALGGWTSVGCANSRPSTSQKSSASSEP